MEKEKLNLDRINQIIHHFQVGKNIVGFEKISIGHINRTYKICVSDACNLQYFILQSINTDVFKSVDGLMNNIMVSARHLKQKKYPKKILHPILTKTKTTYQKDEQGDYWRVYPYFQHTKTFNIIPNPEVAYEIAFTFGEYIRYLDDLDISRLNTTIPDFHNTPLRFQQFNKAVDDAGKNRLKKATEVIRQIHELDHLLSFYRSFYTQLRPVHYDTKINNVLLDMTSKKGVAIIDLDTLMPGMLPYDFGDLVRTGAATSHENETDLKNVLIDPNLLDSLTSGFLEGIKDAIKLSEKNNLKKGAALIIYEQAIRFLTDYLQNDLYYPVQYPDHNLIRSKNQMRLLVDLLRY